MACRAPADYPRVPGERRPVSQNPPSPPRQNETMRAEEVIATHGNTDFDAFASMLAARRLYPNAVVCVSGSLSRNVREFARLHAEELEVVDAGRPELDAIRRPVAAAPLPARPLG